MSTTPDPRPAFCFPGQGSQTVGMGRLFHEASPDARSTFEEASDALGEDIARLCFDGPPEALQLTANTQPAVLTVSVAVAVTLADRASCCPELDTLSGFDEVIGRRAYHTKRIRSASTQRRGELAQKKRRPPLARGPLRRMDERLVLAVSKGLDARTGEKVR